MATIYSQKHVTTQFESRDSVMPNLFYGNDFISIKDLCLQQIEQVLALATQLKNELGHQWLKNKIIAHCFFEPSTRTRLSFEAATLRQGGHVIGFSSDEHLSIQKG